MAIQLALFAKHEGRPCAVLIEQSIDKFDAVRTSAGPTVTAPESVMASHQPAKLLLIGRTGKQRCSQVYNLPVSHIISGDH
jgi:hypothetical protein